MTGHVGPVTAVRWGQSGSGKSHLASCGEDGSVRVWDAEAGACVHEFSEHDTVSCGSMHACASSLPPPGRDRGAAACIPLGRPDRAAHPPCSVFSLCSAQRPSAPSRPLYLQAVSIIAWSPDARYLASGDASGRLLVWSLRAGGVVRSLQVRAGWRGLSIWTRLRRACRTALAAPGWLAAAQLGSVCCSKSGWEPTWERTRCQPPPLLRLPAAGALDDLRPAFQRRLHAAGLLHQRSSPDPGGGPEATELRRRSQRRSGGAAGGPKLHSTTLNSTSRRRAPSTLVPRGLRAAGRRRCHASLSLSLSCPPSTRFCVLASPCPFPVPLSLPMPPLPFSRRAGTCSAPLPGLLDSTTDRPTDPRTPHT